jgi:hypothetical protein
MLALHWELHTSISFRPWPSVIRLGNWDPSVLVTATLD